MEFNDIRIKKHQHKNIKNQFSIYFMLMKLTITITVTSVFYLLLIYSLSIISILFLSHKIPVQLHRFQC